MAEVRELTDGVDYAFSAITSPAGLVDAVRMCGYGGTATLVGVPPPGRSLEVDLERDLFHPKVGDRGHTRRRHDPAAGLPVSRAGRARGRLDLDRFVTKTISLDEVPEALEELHAAKGVRTVVLRPNYFGDEVAARYDASSGDEFEPAVIASTVEFLAGLATDGAALELGIGTGRIALPLAERGVRVSGIDLSEAMVAKLRAKPGGEEIPVAIGDFSTTGIEGAFSLVYLVFNTIMNLTTQDAQVACFANAAAHLEPGGCFVIEVMVPELQRLPFGETIRPFAVTPTRLGFDEYDVVTQGLISHHYRATAEQGLGCGRSRSATRGPRSTT